MISTINSLFKEDIAELKAEVGTVYPSNVTARWTIRAIISVAFGSAFDYRWMGKTYSELVGTLETFSTYQAWLGNSII
jgi:hypothetical protein